MMLSARMSPQPNGTSIGSAVFAQMAAEGVSLYVTMVYSACFPLKIAPSHVGIWTSFK